MKINGIPVGGNYVDFAQELVRKCCYVYCEDEALRAYFKRRINSML